MIAGDCAIMSVQIAGTHRLETLPRLALSSWRVCGFGCFVLWLAWIGGSNREGLVLAWLRVAPGAPPVAVVDNLMAAPRPGDRIGPSHPGRWRDVLSTDATSYGGSGLGNRGKIWAQAEPPHGLPASATILAPPPAHVYFAWQPK